MSDKIIIGYTQGTFDLFHVGHLRLLKRAKDLCDWLIVGVNDDELVMEYKKKHTIIPVQERVEIIRELRCVDEVLITYTLDKKEMLEKLHFQKIFIGDDWKGNERWKKTEEEMARQGVELVYLPYTQGISTTQIEKDIKKGNG